MCVCVYIHQCVFACMCMSVCACECVCLKMYMYVCLPVSSDLRILGSCSSGGKEARSIRVRAGSIRMSKISTHPATLTATCTTFALPRTCRIPLPIEIFATGKASLFQIPEGGARVSLDFRGEFEDLWSVCVGCDGQGGMR